MKPDDIINLLRQLSLGDIRAQLEYDETHRVSRYALVREFVREAAARKKETTTKVEEEK